MDGFPHCKAGRKFSGRITKKDGNTGFGVADPDGDGLLEEDFDFKQRLTGSMVKDGDYKITVTTFESRPLISRWSYGYADEKKRLMAFILLKGRDDDVLAFYAVISFS
jgi:hypothetical protein